ncbi:ABC transporter permease subunit, partial [Acetobacter senegalensis]|uniref:ABC transporter permease subunit n=1 Tax=Acetobacter senegalensis TaxID=446692 RepID=UPI0020A214C1
PQVLITTTLIAVVTGIASAGTAFAVAYLAVRIGGRQGSILRTITLLSLGLPGVAGVIATLWAYVSVPGLRSLYGTTWVMVAALTAGSLTSSVQIVHGALVQISRDLEEASLIAGRDRLQTVFRITMPLLLPTLKSAAFLVGTLVTGNLAVPQLLSAADTRTLALFSYSLYTGGHQTQAAVLLVVWVGFVLSLIITWKIASSLFRVLVFVLRQKNSSSYQSDKKASGMSAFVVGVRPSTNPLERPVSVQTQGASR